MKLLKNSFLGTAFLLVIGTSSFASSDTTAVNFEAPLSDYQFCDIMYPDDFSYFDVCMGFGLDL